MPGHRGVPGAGGGDIGRCCGDSDGTDRSCTPGALAEPCGMDPGAPGPGSAPGTTGKGPSGSGCCRQHRPRWLLVRPPWIWSPNSHRVPCGGTSDLCEHPGSELLGLGVFSPALADSVLSLNVQLVVQLAAGTWGDDAGLLQVMADGDFTPL